MRKLYFFIFSMFLVVSTISVYAESTGMVWSIPFNLSDRKTLHLNFTLADFYNTQPDRVCFGISNQSLCLSFTMQNIEMQNNNITNISYLCNASGECFTLTELNASSSSTGSGTGVFNETDDIYIYNITTKLYINETKLNETTDLRIALNNATVWDYFFNLISSLGNWSADKSTYINASNTSWINDSMNGLILNWSDIITSTGGGNASFNQTLTDSLYAPNASLGVCPNGYVIQNTTTSGVQCVLNTEASTTYYANASSVTGGSYTDRNWINDTYWYDALSHNFTEGSGALPLTVYINYTNVTSFSQWVSREYYLGSSSHFIDFQIWDYDSSSWENYYTISGQSGFTWVVIPVYDTTDHIQDGIVQTRLYHIQNGVSSHRLYIDVAWLVNGNNIGASTNLDGYAKYSFGYNNFNGNGNFTTTNTVSANLMFTNQTCYNSNCNKSISYNTANDWLVIGI